MPFLKPVINQRNDLENDENCCLSYQDKQVKIDSFIIDMQLSCRNTFV